MTDFGLDDKITDEEKLLEALRWHELLEPPEDLPEENGALPEFPV